jgi:hypothetical protein
LAVNVAVIHLAAVNREKLARVVLLPERETHD